MYIRRKVFSVMEDAFGEERYFSTTDLDYGYANAVLADRYFSDDDSLLGAGIGAGVGVGAGLAGTYGLSKLKADAAGKAITAKDIEKFEKSQLLSRKGKNGDRVLTKLGKEESRLINSDRLAALQKKFKNNRALQSVSGEDYDRYLKITGKSGYDYGNLKGKNKDLVDFIEKNGLKNTHSYNNFAGKDLSKKEVERIQATLKKDINKARDARKAERLNEWASGFNKGESTFGGRLGESARGAMKDKKKLAAIAGGLGVLGAGTGYLIGRD